MFTSEGEVTKMAHNIDFHGETSRSLVTEAKEGGVKKPVLRCGKCTFDGWEVCNVQQVSLRSRPT
jgi:hypothetical protein